MEEIQKAADAFINRIDRRADQSDIDKRHEQRKQMLIDRKKRALARIQQGQ